MRVTAAFHDVEAPIWEQAVALTGLIIVLSMITYLVYQGIWGDRSPPDLVAEAVSIERSGTNHLVEIVVHNHGGNTAATVRVQGTLTLQDGSVETAEATVDYVPSGSRAGGGMFFDGDPRLGRLDLQASGYQAP